MRDAMSCDRPVDTQHVNVVAQNLEIIGGVVFGEQAFVMQHRTPRIGGHLQMAAEACRRPRSVAGVAGHFFV